MESSQKFAHCFSSSYKSSILYVKVSFISTLEDTYTIKNTFLPAHFTVLQQFIF